MVFKKLLYQNFFWRGLNLLSFFLLNVGIARTFGAAASGSLFFIINFFALLLLIATLSMEAGLGYFTAKQTTAGAWQVVLPVLWGFAAAGIAAVLLPWLPAGEELLPARNFYGSAFLYVAGYLLLVFFTALFSAKQHFVLPNLVAALANTALLVLLPAHASDKTAAAGNFLTVYFTAFFVQGLLLALLFALLYVKKNAQHLPQTGMLRAMVLYSLQAFAANIIFFLVYRVDYWMVNYFCAEKEMLGNYIQVSRIAQVFFILPGIAAGTVFSVTASGKKEAMNETVLRLSRVICLMAVAGCLVLAACGWWLFPLLFGSGFSGMYIPFLLLVPGITAIATLYPFTAYYAGKNRVAENIRGSLLALFVIIAGDLLLVPVWGISGAALASSAGYIAYEAYLLHVFRREYGFGLKDCFILKKDDWQRLAASVRRNKNGL